MNNKSIKELKYIAEHIQDTDLKTRLEAIIKEEEDIIISQRKTSADKVKEKRKEDKYYARTKTVVFNNINSVINKIKANIYVGNYVTAKELYIELLNDFKLPKYKEFMKDIDVRIGKEEMEIIRKMG